jgi:hypothetical protein
MGLAPNPSHNTPLKQAANPGCLPAHHGRKHIMAIPDSTKLAACQAAADKGDWVSVFTGASGTDGSNEGTGVTRAQTTWQDKTDHVQGTEVNVKCDAATYKEAGAFSAKTSGNFAGGGEFSNGDVVVSGTGGSVDVTLSWV